MTKSTFHFAGGNYLCAAIDAETMIDCVRRNFARSISSSMLENIKRWCDSSTEAGQAAFGEYYVTRVPR